MQVLDELGNVIFDDGITEQAPVPQTLKPINEWDDNYTPLKYHIDANGKWVDPFTPFGLWVDNLATTWDEFVSDVGGTAETAAQTIRNIGRGVNQTVNTAASLMPALPAIALGLGVLYILNEMEKD